ncbi:HTH_Tnp_Tc3_2 domain-containing protein [Trichonephila clavipes]|nr:HTH_Tnp_Tc3_2 domain-containing protein [Trichonephila clavipes]
MALGSKICSCKVSGSCLWKNCYAYVSSYRSTSHRGVYKCLPHDTSILSPRGLPGLSRPVFPRVAKRNRRATYTRVTSMVTASISKAISAAFVRQRLHMNRLYARVPRVCVPLSVQSRGARLKWCWEHGNWTVSGAMSCILMSQDLLWSQMTSV